MVEELSVGRFGEGYKVVAEVSANYPGKLLGIARLFGSLFFRREPIRRTIGGTLHEACHILADPGEGTIGLQYHSDPGEFRRIVYTPRGLRRTPQERIKVARAPRKLGLRITAADMAIEAEAYKEIRMEELDSFYDLC